MRPIGPSTADPTRTGSPWKKPPSSGAAIAPRSFGDKPTNTGFSSFTVSDGKVFTQVVREIKGKSREICLALDAATGKELWIADIARGEGYSGGDTAGGGDGPRSTPTVSDGKVYLLTPDLVTHCLDADTGRPIWKRDLMKQHHGRNIGWNSAASVAVDGNLVFVGGGGPGESMLGLNKNTGDGRLEDRRRNHHPLHARRGHDPRSAAGDLLHEERPGLGRQPRAASSFGSIPFHFSVSTAISPVVSGDIVYLSAGYGVGSAACRIEKQGGRFTATKLWFSPGNEPVVNHWSTPVCKDGYLYGMFGFKKFKKGPMKCVELATGKVMWSQPGFGQGNVILVGNRLVALAEDGNLVIIEATPEAYKEIARTKAFQDKCWTTPAFADGKIYVRSISQGICFDVSEK